MPPKKVPKRDDIQSDGSDSSYSPPRTRRSAHLAKKVATSKIRSRSQSDVEEETEHRNENQQRNGNRLPRGVTSKKKRRGRAETRRSAQSGRFSRSSQIEDASSQFSSSSESEEYEQSERDTDADDSLRSEPEDTPSKRRITRSAARMPSGAGPSNRPHAGTPSRELPRDQAARRARSHLINGSARPRRLEDLMGSGPRRSASIDSGLARRNSRYLEDSETASEIGLPQAASTPRPPRRRNALLEMIDLMNNASSDDEPIPSTPRINAGPREGFVRVYHEDDADLQIQTYGYGWSEDIPIKEYRRREKAKNEKMKAEKKEARKKKKLEKEREKEKKRRIRMVLAREKAAKKRREEREKQEKKEVQKILKEQAERDAALAKQTLSNLRESVRDLRSAQRAEKMRRKQELSIDKAFENARLHNFVARLSVFNQKQYLSPGLRDWNKRPRRSCTTLTPNTSASNPSPNIKCEAPRKRSASLPRSFYENELVPKTPIKVIEAVAPYTKALNLTLTELLSLPRKVHRFGKMASEKAERIDRNWSNILDPFYSVMKLRREFVRQKYCSNATADAQLELSDSDSPMTTKHEWTSDFQRITHSFMDSSVQSSEEFSEVKFLKKYTEFHSLRDVSLVISAHFDRSEAVDALRFLVEKFFMHFAMWKCQEEGRKLPRMVHYFLFFIKKTVGGIKRINNGEHLQQIKELLFWLPIHLGDTRSKICAPREQVMDLSRQLARVLLNDFPLLFASLRQEDAHALYRLELSNLRIETLLGPAEDWMPYWRPCNRTGVFGRLGRPEEKLEVERKVRRRSHSFSEFTEDVPILDRAAMAEAMRIRNLPPLAHVKLPDFYGLAI